MIRNLNKTVNDEIKFINHNSIKQIRDGNN